MEKELVEYIVPAYDLPLNKKECFLWLLIVLPREHLLFIMSYKQILETHFQSSLKWML